MAPTEVDAPSVKVAVRLKESVDRLTIAEVKLLIVEVDSGEFEASEFEIIEELLESSETGVLELVAVDTPDEGDKLVRSEADPLPTPKELEPELSEMLERMVSEFSVTDGLDSRVLMLDVTKSAVVPVYSSLLFDVLTDSSGVDVTDKLILLGLLILSSVDVAIASKLVIVKELDVLIELEPGPVFDEAIRLD